MKTGDERTQREVIYFTWTKTRHKDIHMVGLWNMLPPLTHNNHLYCWSVAMGPNPTPAYMLTKFVLSIRCWRHRREAFVTINRRHSDAWSWSCEKQADKCFCPSPSQQANTGLCWPLICIGICDISIPSTAEQEQTSIDWKVKGEFRPRHVGCNQL